MNIYLPMSVRNCFRECDEDLATVTRNSDAQMVPELKSLVEVLARKRAQWQFVFPGYSRDQYQLMRIEQDGEALGTVELRRQWHRGCTQDVYRLTNKYLARQRQRSGDTETIDPKKAAKLILDNYRLRSLPERLQEKYQTTHQKVNLAVSIESTKFVRAKNDIEEPLIKALISRDDVRATVQAALPTSAAETLDLLPSLYALSNDALGINAALSGGRGTVVACLGPKYHVFPSSPGGVDDAVTLDAEHLPNTLRGYVGMLKLVEVGTLVPNVGVRVDDNTFFINEPMASLLTAPE